MFCLRPHNAREFNVDNRTTKQTCKLKALSEVNFKNSFLAVLEQPHLVGRVILAEFPDGGAGRTTLRLGWNARLLLKLGSTATLFQELSCCNPTLL